MSLEPIIKAADLAGLLGCAVTTVNDLARRGELPGLRLGDGGYVFPAEALVERLNAMARESAKARRAPKTEGLQAICGGRAKDRKRKPPPVLPAVQWMTPNKPATFTTSHGHGHGSPPCGIASTDGLGVTRFVVVDGRTVQPEEWMWVLGFALAGVPWAVETASTPEFRECCQAGMKKMHDREVESEIAHLERRIAALRAGLTTNVQVSGNTRP